VEARIAREKKRGVRKKGALTLLLLQPGIESMSDAAGTVVLVIMRALADPCKATPMYIRVNIILATPSSDF